MIFDDDIIWFVHLGYEPPLPLRLKRLNVRGAEVVGGKSGSHITGHGESYWDKIVEIVKYGYIPVNVAKDIGLLDASWNPPNIKSLDKLVSRGVFQLRK